MRSRVFTPSNFIKILLVSLTLLLVGQASSLRAAGEDDDLLVPGFGAGFNGKGFVEVHEFAFTAAVQPDGKIVVGGRKNGHFWLARYKTDGALDTGFGQNGEVITPFSTSKADTILDVTIKQPFGEIVAVGGAENAKKTAIAQYNTDGRLDFQTTLNFDDSQEAARSVAIQPDGRIVVGGFADECGLFTCNDDEFALARLNPDGTPDSSFHNDGMRMIGLGTPDDILNTILVQTDGKIVGIGEKIDAIGAESRVGVVRLEPNGRLDSSLDNDGKLSSAYIGRGADGLVQADGKIVAVTSHGKMVRFNPNGSVDASFGPAGLVDLATPAGAFSGGNFDIQIELGTNGHFLVAGQLESGERVVVRYTLQGHPDPSFNAGQGYAQLPVKNQISDMVVGRDGKIIILQSRFLTRLLPDGRLDRGEGRAFSNLTDSFEKIFDAALQPDGKIVVTGYYGFLANNRLQTRWLIARYTDGGHLDTEFGDAGLITEPAISSQGRAVALDRQGRILVAGVLFGHTGELTLRRYNPDGSPAFFPAAPGGRWPLFDMGTNFPFTWEIVVQPDNKIVLAGASQDSDQDFTLLRYLDSGGPDPGFNNGGEVVTDFGGQGGHDIIEGLALQPDGKLVVVGRTRPLGGKAEDDRLALARYRPNGALDPDFGGDGKVTGPVRGGNAALAIQPDGKIVTGGTVYLANGRRVFGALRYTAAGTPDLTFNGTSQSLVDFDEDAVATDLALEPDGVISLAGCVVGGQVDPFAMVRLRPNGQPDGAFSGDGKATFAMSLSNACAHSIVQEATGDYILAGYAEVTPVDDQVALARVKGRGINNQPPRALPNDYAALLNTPLIIAAPGVLGNDSDPEGQPLNAQLVTPSKNGQVSLNSDGGFSYTPKEGFSGADRFTYRASDSFELSDPITVTITINATEPDPTPNPNPSRDFTVFLPLAVK